LVTLADVKRFVATLVALALCWLVAVSGEDVYISYFTLGLVVATVVFLVTLLALRRWKWCAAAVVTLAFVGVLGGTGFPSETRLELSHSAIKSAGREVLAGGSPRRAGLYAIESSWVAKGGCAVLVTHTVLIEYEGFLYCPKGADSLGFPKLLESVYEYST
jgi:hypothetical protein